MNYELNTTTLYETVQAIKTFRSDPTYSFPAVIEPQEHSADIAPT